MRIAWVVPGFQGRDDEPGIPALTALAHTLTKSHELQVFTVRFPPRTERYQLGAVQVRGFGGMERRRAPMARRAASLWRWVRVLSALAQAHRRSKIDIIHGWWGTESGMLASLAGRLLGVPTVVSLAGGELAGVRAIGYGSRIRPLEWGQVLLALHLATAIGVPSHDARCRLLVHAPWLRRRLLPLPLGYDPAVFATQAVDAHGSLDAVPLSGQHTTRPQSLASPDDGVTPTDGAPVPVRQKPADPGDSIAAGGAGHMVCVASWTPVKGHDLLLDAAALLKARGVPFHLTLAGERTDHPDACAAVAARGIQDHVSHLGALTQQGVSALLAGAHLLALASWHEAECLAVVEALACGVPVVAPPVGIARELLTDPRLGTCIQHRSPAHLAGALQAQLQRDLPDEASARLFRQESVAHLALPRVVDRLMAAYADLRGVSGITHPGAVV